VWKVRGGGQLTRWERDGRCGSASNLGTPPFFREMGRAMEDGTRDGHRRCVPPRTCPWAASRLTCYGVGACAVNYTRGSIDPVRPRVTCDATFVQTERLSLSKTNVDSPWERVPFQSGGSNKCIERGQLFLEYVGVNLEIDREMGSLKKRPMEIDTLPAGPIASRHTGHARPTSLVFPPSVTCSTNSTTHQASFVQSRGGSP
jgi:hypothetical protein